MQRSLRRSKAVVLASTAVFAAIATLSGCSGGGSAAAGSNNAAISLSLDTAAITTQPGGSPVVVHTLSSRTNTQDAISLAVSSLPAGLTATITQPGVGTAGSVAFAEMPNAAGGTYPLTITASTGTVSAVATLTATVTAADAVTIAPPTAQIVVSQDGTPLTSAFTVGRSFGNSSSISVSASGLPGGLTASLTQPGSGTAGSITLAVANTPAVAGTYMILLTASDGIASATSTIPVVVAIAEHIYNTVDTTLGVNGHLQQAMSTGFQPQTYSDTYLPTFGSAATAQLAALNPQHVRVQPVGADVPQQASSSPQMASDWSFAALDKTMQPLLATGDASPQLQIATAPPFLNDSNGAFVVNPTNLSLLASYAANVVRYYNTGGFTWGGQHFQSPSTRHVTWWAIFNEPNLNGLTPAQYVQLYNTLVPAMLAVDPTIKFSALELSGFTGEPQKFMPTLVLPAGGGGLNAQVDALATHFYGSCNQSDTDATIFAQVAEFTSEVNYMRTELNARSDLSGLPVWVTENNVNADYQLPNGKSSCQPTQNFVSDARGSSAFFAAWRPYVFSQLGKAGNHALYQFTFAGSDQYGEVDASTNKARLSYWVDYWLQRYFPFAPSTVGATILRATTTEKTNTVEVLATRNPDDSVSLLVSDIAPANAGENNGTGSPRTVLLDVSALGTFSTASTTTLDASTPIAAGPSTVTANASSVLAVTLAGYGTTFIKLTP